MDGKKETDFITIFECSDGLNVLKDVRISKTFNANVNFKEAGKQLLSDFKKAGATIIKGAVDFFQGKEVNGLSFFGMGDKLLKDSLSKVNASYQITNNQLEIFYNNTALNTQIPLLTPETGLVGSVTRRKKVLNLRL